ncbi:MAG: hypothetical protein IH605_06390 [Burkholderiales bacterium]|nr:hypothetical protein [Burkholderiales bacterium]
MHKMLIAVLAGLLCLSVAQAQDKKSDEKAAKPTPPKVSSTLIKRMRDCRKEALDKKLQGDARTLFVSRCIDGSDAAPRIAAAKAAEKKRKKRELCLKTAMARELRGEELKKFLSECQKG